MPELPFVEATRLHLLTKGLIGKTVKGMDIGWSKAIGITSPNVFKRALGGKSIREIDRRAKYLIFRLDHGTLLIHLRMTGSLTVVSSDTIPDKFTHNVLFLDDGREFRFRDPRKLGMMWFLEDESSFLMHLGPEPLGVSFTEKVLKSCLEGRAGPIKYLLCQQELLAGIGNIYADEILFHAGINPQRGSNTLVSYEWVVLHQCMQSVLLRATEMLTNLMPIQPITRESNGKEGVLMVPRLRGGLCPKCGSSVSRLLIRSRSSFCCLSCQV